MKTLLIKELKLSTPILTYLFLAFTLMTFLPGYPILCGAFFVCLGIFQGFQYDREANDILYSVLLPVKKKDIVKAKYLGVFTIEMMAFFLFTVFTFVRMIFLNGAVPYANNLLMAANLVFLAFVLLIFAAFNGVFIGGFFKTAYGLGKPFVAFNIACFTIIGIAETLHHIPGLTFLNALDGSFIGVHSILLLAAIAVYLTVTILSCKKAERRFEMIDL